MAASGSRNGYDMEEDITESNKDIFYKIDNSKSPEAEILRFPVIKQLSKLQNFNKPTSSKLVCKQPSIRELGVHAVAKLTPSVFNSMMERKGGQGLIEARTGTSFENRDNTQLGVTIPKLIQFPITVAVENDDGQEEGQDNVNQIADLVDENDDERNQNELPSTWFQIDLNMYDGIQMGITENGLVWSCCRNPTHEDPPQEDVVDVDFGEDEDDGDFGPAEDGDGDGDESESEDDDVDIEAPEVGLLQFYVYSPIKFKLITVASRPIVGTGITTSKVFETVSNNETFKFLLMLTNANEVLAFDLIKKEFGPVLLLRVSDRRQITCFNEIHIMYEHKQILVLEKLPNQTLKSIVIFQFPSNWKQVSVIDLGQFQIKFAIQNNLCAILRKGTTELIITTWTQLIENATSLVPITRRALHSSIKITHDWHIDALPENGISITMMKHGNFQFLNLDPPMVVVDDNTNGKSIYKLFLFDHSQYAELQFQVSGRIGQLGDRFTRFVAIPGDFSLSRMLIRNRMITDYQVISFWKNKEGVITDSVRSLPFEDWYVPTGHNMIPTRKAILGIAFCKTIGFYAVLFAYESKLNVNIYEPSANLRIVRALSIVERVTSRHFRVVDIKKVFMTFEPDLLSVNLTFDLSRNDDDNDSHASVFTEAYCYPLMLEERQQLLDN